MKKSSEYVPAFIKYGRITIFLRFSQMVKQRTVLIGSQRISVRDLGPQGVRVARFNLNKRRTWDHKIPADKWGILSADRPLVRLGRGIKAQYNNK